MFFIRMTKKLLIIFIIIGTRSFAQECPPDTLQIESIQDSWSLPYLNDWDNVEIMTWNLKEFPLNQSTPVYLNDIVSDLLPDIILFQEINDIAQFQEFVSDLGGAYSVVHTSNGSLNLGLIARSECADIQGYSTLFTSNYNEFVGRFPLKVDLIWSCGLRAINLEIINVHLKAFDEGFDQRLAASEIISNYVNENLDRNIIIAGDFNDEIDDPEFNNSLWPLVENPNTLFVTSSVSSLYDQYSWIGGSPHSFLDHILISSALYDENEGSQVETIRIDDYVGYSFYKNYISDHRPVVWSFTIPEIDLPDGIVINEIMRDPGSVSDSYGEWIEIYNYGTESVSLNGLLLKDNDGDNHIINSSELIIPGEYFVIGSSSDYNLNGGVIVDYAWDNFNLSNFFDEIIIEHPSGIVLDYLEYDFGQTFSTEEGYSIELIDPLADNSSGYNWHLSENVMPSGDYGTPGYQNSVVDADDCGLIGDVNYDTTINILDVVQIIGYVLGEINFSSEQQCRADFNVDSSIDILDVVQLISAIVS